MGVGAFERPNQRAPSRYESRNFLRVSEVEEFNENGQNLNSNFEISRWIFEEIFQNVFFLAFRLVNASYDH